VILAMVFSLIDHVRLGYSPKDSVLVPTTGEHLHSIPAGPGAQTVDGLVVYHFAASLYYANANHFSEEILGLTTENEPQVRWLGLDASAIADIDFSGAATVREIAGSLRDRGIRFTVAEVAPDVRAELDLYGLTDEIGEDAIFETVSDMIDAYHRTVAGSG
jgi:sulfate permease, SulP family